MSQSHVWSPSSETRAAGERAASPYRRAYPTAPGEQRSPAPALVALRDAIRQTWPEGITSIGLRRDSERIADASNDPHRDGIAADVMIADSSARPSLGDMIASRLVESAEELNLQYVLWSRLEWSSSNIGRRWEPYDGAEAHEDHVHVEIGPVAREWSYDTMYSRALAALAPKPKTSSAWKTLATAAAIAIIVGMSTLALTGDRSAGAGHGNVGVRRRGR